MEVRSQSLPLFRAFQHNDLGDMYYIKEKVAIPSFIQGISTLAMAKVTMPALSVAIPSFIQGISTRVFCSASPTRGVGRNPFLYSGHFNTVQIPERGIMI